MAKLFDEGYSDERDESARRSVSMLKTMGTHAKLRLMSQVALDKTLDWHLDDGVAYHVISYGDVDSLTYLRHIIRDQRVDYVLLSTWCMAMVDAEEIARWIESGKVGRIDFYVGEIFKNGYRGVRDVIENTALACGGRVARFRNHSKVMVVFGKNYDCVIESSANVDTNPRCEQTCITVDSSLAEFYKQWYDEIKSFDKWEVEWKPWER